MPQLSYGRTLLREYRGEDFNAISAWANDDGTTRYLSTAFWIPQSDDDCRSYLDNRMHGSHNNYWFVIAKRDDGSYLGQMDLYSVDWRLRCGTLGILLLPEARGMGYGGEALRLIKQFAFLTLGLERLELQVHEDNIPAIRCYERAGFLREGVRRSAYYSDGDFHDVIMMGMLRSDFDRHGREEYHGA